MKNLNKTVSIAPTFSWKEWGLYDWTASVGAANKLNDTMILAVSAGISETGFRREMLKAMAEFANLGALDTEPRDFLERVIEEIFG